MGGKINKKKIKCYSFIVISYCIRFDRKIHVFPSGSVVKNLPANARDVGSIPGSGRSPGEGNGNPLQFSCLENPMDGGAWLVHGSRKEWDTTERLHFHFHYFNNLGKSDGDLN